MDQYSTREAAKKLGLHLATLQRYLAEGKIPAPPVQDVGGNKFRVWTEDDIDRVREILPKIANGRKTRYQKLREKQKAQPRAAVPHKTRKHKKK
jgi:excisionase family DNA binding protein